MESRDPRNDRVGVPRSLVTLAARRHLMLDYANTLSRRLSQTQNDLREVQRRSDMLLRHYRQDLASVRRQKVELDAQLLNKSHTITQLQEYTDWLIQRLQALRSEHQALQQRYHLLQVDILNMDGFYRSIS